MSALQEESPVTATDLGMDDNHRLAGLLKHFGPGHHAAAPEYITDTLSHLAPNTYRGDYWRFYELSNGGFFMAPTEAQNLTSSPASRFARSELEGRGFLRR